MRLGSVDTYGRADNEAIASGPPRLPTRAVEHRGRTLPEFELDGAPAFEADGC